MKTFNYKNLIISLCALSSTAFGLEHQNLMWGVSNQIGSNGIYIDLNPMQSYRVQSRQGQDVHLDQKNINGKKIKVAILDTGIDFDHPDLKNYVIKNGGKCVAFAKLNQCLEEAADDSEKKDACRTEHLQAEANVYPADCRGWSILDQDIKNTPNNIIGRPDFSDASGHGTHVAGTILSVTKNVELIPVQVVGDGPNQPIKPFSIDLSPNEDIREGFQSNDNLSERVARGIIYAMNSGAQVINLSLGWPEDQNTDIIKEAIVEAQNRGIIIVAAAGNDSTNALLRPCQYKGVICVAATRPDGALAGFTNFGFGVDIAAPGVEILSTIPMNKRSIRLPGFSGYDYLSGTSQATPFVTAVVAEMLSRGIPANEIYPRLILGARPILSELPVIVGPYNSKGLEVRTETSYKKTVLSGQLDLSNSVQVAAQPLILPADKETQVIDWDRQSSKISFQFQLKNYWKSISGKNISIQVKPTSASEIEPAVVKSQMMGSSSSWSMNEERAVQVDLQIKDQAKAELSRMPSELSYQVLVMIDGKLHRQFEIHAEVIVKLKKEMNNSDILHIPMQGTIPQGMTLKLVDEVYDADQANRDYFVTGQDSKDKQTFQIGLLKSSQGIYKMGDVRSIKFDGDVDQIRARYRMRLDIDGDGISEYVYGIIEYLDKDLTVYGPYKNHFYVFDQNLNLKKYFQFDDRRALLPLTFFWMKVGNSLRPAWVGLGQKVVTEWDITDLWGQDEDKDIQTEMGIHFYYLDEDFKLAQVQPKDESQRIVDVVRPTLQQIQNGILPIMLAKNKGTELKPSYIYDFTLATVTNAQISTQKSVDSLNSSISYRNIVDTFADATMNLNASVNEYLGTMWYGLDAHQKQRVTLLDPASMKIYDRSITSNRSIFDAALQVRAGFQSKDRMGVFLTTNSEIEYHDLQSGKAVGHSLNRYSFFGDNNFVELQYPITVSDNLSIEKKLPGLFTTEGSGLSRGVKMLVPIFAKNGSVQQMVSPARLRLKTEKGCKSLESPVYLGQKSGYAMDYYCGDQILRVLLKY